MKTSKFSTAQTAFVFKQAESGTVVGEVCRKAGISEATYYNLRKRYAGLMPSEVKRQRLRPARRQLVNQVAGGLHHQHEADTQALQRVGASAPIQYADATREGDAQGRSN